MIKEISFNALQDFDVKESNNPFTKYIAFVDKNILGYIEYNDIYDTIDIVNVFVKEDYRNKKVGTKLLIFLIESNKDKKNITLEVNSKNTIAIRLYEKLGFKKVAKRKGYYEGIDGYLMELKLWKIHTY